MERFWDARAREDAYYFVDSRLEYKDPDEAAFWEGGSVATQALLAAVDARPVGPQDVVLDIGCGLGRLTRALADQAGRVIGLDVSSEMIERARRLNAHLDNVQFIHGDGESLSGIAEESIDICVSHVVFRHIPDPAIILGYVTDSARVLRPGGFAVYEFSNAGAPHVHRFSQRFGRFAALVGRAPRGVTEPPWTGSSVPLDDLRRAATDAGLAVEAVTGEGTQFCVVRLRRPAKVG